MSNKPIFTSNVVFIRLVPAEISPEVEAAKEEIANSVVDLTELTPGFTTIHRIINI